MHPGSSTARLVSNAFCSTEVMQSTTTKDFYESFFLGLGSSKQGKMWPIMFGHILFLTARPALCHLSLYFCFTSTDARKRATFSAFQKSRELGDDAVVVCGMAPIILIYLPRHLEMVTCQKNIIHNISERSQTCCKWKICPCLNSIFS